MISPLVTVARGRPGQGRGRLLLALAIGQALTVAAGARAQDVCTPKFRAGSQVWYAVETQPQVARYSDSACTLTGGADAGVRFMVKGSQEIIFCDLDLRIPEAMKAELKEAERQVPTELPSSKRGRAETWETLVRKYSRELVCAPGFERTSDGASDVPSVWCQRRMTARELCPRPGTTFSEGACYSMACPEGTVDLDPASGGKLAGCYRCPVGRLDVKESLAWQDQTAWSSKSQVPVTAVLCRASVGDRCPGSRSSTAAHPPPPARTTAAQVDEGR